MAKKLTWQAYASPGQFDANLARKMKEAGCDLLITTLDSGDDAVLEQLGKPFRVADAVACVKACQEADLNAIYCLTLGGPGETIDTVMKTLAMMQSLKPAKVTFGEPQGLRVYPDTPLAEIVREEGFTKSNPNLHGPVEGNEELLRPVYYLSKGMGFLIPLIQAQRWFGHWHHRLVRK
jgi:tryptophan 2-C-methyltransferase